jgi:hypothetical protein
VSVKGRNQCIYFGWDESRPAAILEAVYDEFTAKPDTRFWR